MTKMVLLAVVLLVFKIGFSNSILRANQDTIKKPNILLVISDDLNTKIGPYMDVDEHTPNLDRLAKEGVRFSKTYCQYPLCGPSRASIMSGLYPETNGILANNGTLGSYKAKTPELAQHPSIAGFFKENGYFTARVSKIFHMGVPGDIERGAAGGDEPGSWDYAYNLMAPETMSPGEIELLSPKNLHYGSNFSRIVLEDGLERGQADYLAVSQAIAIMENRAKAPPLNALNKKKLKEGHPFFLAVGLIRPHVPFVAPKKYFDQYPEGKIQLPKVFIGDNIPQEALRLQNEKRWGMNGNQQRLTIGAYLASVRFMDEQVGRLLDALDSLDLRGETIIVFISDHGYNLGEHDCWSKISLWEGSVRVPMIISDPRFKKAHGTVSESVVELIDLYPTLLDLCGFSHNAPKILQGSNFSKYLKNDKVKVDQKKYAYTVSNGGSSATIRTSRWRYTRWGHELGKANEELYDHNNDPEELVNLALDKKYGGILNDLREKFEFSRKKAVSKL